MRVVAEANGKAALRTYLSAERPFLYSPAILAAAEVALAAAAAPTALRALAPLRRSCFVNHQRPAHECSAVARLHRLRRGCIVVNFHEPESPGFATEPVAEDIHAIDVNTSLLEKRLQIGLRSLVGQIPYEKLCH